MPRVVVIGAGAAGTMAAIFAAQTASPPAEVLLVERTKDGGRKILISGGGRCNILPSEVDERRFVSDSPPHLVRRILRSWPLRDQIAFLEDQAGIPLVEEPESAKLFPRSQSARDVRDRLLAFAKRCGVKLVTNTLVNNFAPVGSKWKIECDGSTRIEADALVVATGGLSVPATGSDGRGIAIAERLGHHIRRPYAALTPLISSPAPFARLSGLSVPVTLVARSQSIQSAATGGFLFTHGGYSGPAVLDISHVAVRSRLEDDRQAQIAVRWTPLDAVAWETALRPQGNRTVVSSVSEHLPGRLAETLVETAGIAKHLPLSQLTRDARRRLIDALVRFDLPWTSDEGYKKAEVTGGGVKLTEVDPVTLESRKYRGLFLCGEMLDAFGPIGGYNFLWAWVTGRAAGLGASKMLC